MGESQSPPFEINKVEITGTGERCRVLWVLRRFS